MRPAQARDQNQGSRPNRGAPVLHWSQEALVLGLLPARPEGKSGLPREVTLGSAGSVGQSWGEVEFTLLFVKVIYSFIFGCAGSLLMRGLFSGC